MSPSRQALVVAVDEYDDHDLSTLRAPLRDAELLAQTLGDPRVGNFDVDVLRNVTAQQLRLRIEDFFADRQRDDLLLLHFSCHGLKNAAGELFLAVADTKPSRLASTALAADFVNRQMAESRAQRIALFLDCCYGGAFPRGMVVRGGNEVQVGDAFDQRGVGSSGRGRVILTASSSVEYAFEGGELTDRGPLEPSVFTGALVEGLTTGEADQDGDGWVGVSELFGYVADRVRRTTPHQTPHMWTFGSQGELLLAQSRRRLVQPQELPVELTEAAHAPLVATRLGVTFELRDLLHGADLGRAVAAWVLLESLVDDDSRRVATSAAEARAAAAPSVTSPIVDLGTVVPGQTATAQIGLDGPPLAHAVTIGPTPAWLSIDLDAVGLSLTATASDPGPQETSVVITAPTGQTSLTVRMVVGAPPRSRRRQPAPPAPLSPTPAAPVPAAPVPAAPVPATPVPATPTTGPTLSRSLSLTVATLLFVCAAGLVVAHHYIDTLWYLPNATNVKPSVGDGFDLTALMLGFAAIGAAVAPARLWLAIGLGLGVGTSGLAWSALTLGWDPADPAVWRPWAAVAVVGGVAVATSGVALRLSRPTQPGPNSGPDAGPNSGPDAGPNSGPDAGSGWRRPQQRELVGLAAGVLTLVLATLAGTVQSTVAWYYHPEAAVIVPAVGAALATVAVCYEAARPSVWRLAAGVFLASGAWAMVYLAAHGDAEGYAWGTAAGELLLIGAVLDADWLRRVRLALAGTATS